MRNTQTHNWPAATSSGRTRSDAGKLSRKVRKFAHRSYRFLKTSTRTDAPGCCGIASLPRLPWS